MNPAERERRIAAAVQSWITETEPGDFIYDRFRAALNAADEAVPVVSEAEMQHRSRIDHEAVKREHERAERAEAAARELASLAQRITANAPAKSCDPWVWIGATMDALCEARVRHPSFSGKEGTAR